MYQLLNDSSLFPAAKLARTYLNGFHLFDSLHTLQIEFAWTERLNVMRNDIYTWDITKVQPSYSQIDPAYALQLQQEETCSDSYYTPHSLQKMVTFAPTPGYEPNIMLVTGLTFSVSNTRALFNLLSLYGNVAKIQFLSAAESEFGTAMVEMFDAASVECCLHYLNELPLGYNARLQLFWSDQTYKPNELSSFMLADASCSFEDFTQSRNQRFLVQRPMYWIQPPSRYLRFYNTPLDTTRESMIDLFARQNIRVKEVEILPIDDSAPSTRGLLEFFSLTEAAYGKCSSK